MNEVLKTIKARRGNKEYLDKPVPKELIDTIMDAGLWAPSGRGRQSSVIIAFTEADDIARLRDANRSFIDMDIDPFYGAPAVLVVLGEKSSPTYVYDGALAMENMMLAATSLGLGSRWIHRAKEVFELPEWKEFLQKLGLTGEYEGIANMILGYAADEPEPAPRNEGRTFYASEA